MGRLVRQGCKGADVRAIQDVLNFHVRRLAPLVVDGDFGPRTHARVTEFQKSNQLQADGIVGPRTLAKLLEEEQLQITLALVPQAGSTVGGSPRGIQPPRLIPPLTLPPLTPPFVTPFFLPPDSSSRIPVLTPTGQTLSFLTTAPARNDPIDPATRSFNEIMRLLDRLPQSFPFRGTIIGAVPRPVRKVGPLQLDPVSPMSFGFQWGVKPLFDLKSIGPPIQFTVGGGVNARYILKLIDKPGSTVPQLGLFVQGDFKGTIDWTSQTAESRPQIDLKGSILGGLQGRF
ncbi:peptidoglycan-binding domain-containing protein [Reyranella sp.]|jgi:peptidoglycan hydrolase-like protein with peptidoglycan-binding domain|uniref:peptidoglycan-binding domain-containing protein n=1 Tax=Reyranella sp. TaxID=1929291 RepID=UPI003D112CEE